MVSEVIQVAQLSQKNLADCQFWSKYKRHVSVGSACLSLMHSFSVASANVDNVEIAYSDFRDAGPLNKSMTTK